jgi:hypothetical protein
MLFFVAETCANIESNAINVTKRTSTMFTALITYNCSLINRSYLLVYNETLDNCSVTESSVGTENDTVNVTCDNIKNSAGRNLGFGLIRNQSSQIIKNETFTITLEPLSINTTSINITIENLTATIFVPNCGEIADPNYLVFRCNSSDTSNSTLFLNCTLTCSDLEPGSVYNVSLVRLSIPKTDKTDGNDTNFPEESRNESLYIG